VENFDISVTVVFRGLAKLAPKRFRKGRFVVVFVHILRWTR
jgi:hypothetical protein